MGVHATGNRYLHDDAIVYIVGYEQGTVDVDALVDPTAEGNDRQLLDFTPITSDN